MTNQSAEKAQINARQRDLLAAVCFRAEDGPRWYDVLDVVEHIVGEQLAARAEQAATRARADALREALGDDPMALSMGEFVKRANSVYSPGQAVRP